MKLILENEYGRYEIDEKEDLDIHIIIDLFERLLISASFHPETVKDGFVCKADEINTEDKEDA